MYLKGYQRESIILTPAGNHNCINLSANSGVTEVNITGVTGSNIGIYIQNNNVYIMGIGFNDCARCLVIDAVENIDSRYTRLVCEYTTTALEVVGNGNDVNLQIPLMSTETSTLSTDGILIDSANVVIQNLVMNGSGNTTRGIKVLGTGVLNLSGTVLRNFGSCVYADPTAATGSQIIVAGSSFELLNNQYALYIDSPNTSGFLDRNIEDPYIYIATGSTFYCNGKNFNIITVGKIGCDFTTLKSAIEYIITKNPSASNRFRIELGPGEFIEDNSTDTIKLYDYIDLCGHDLLLTTISPSDPTKNFIEIMSPYTMISDMQINGPTTTGMSTIVYDGSSTIDRNLRLVSVRIGTTDSFLKITSTTGSICVML